MRALFDVNVLLALSDADHVHHRRALSWWQQHKMAGWASCAITENGFLRIISQPRYAKPVTLSVAIGLLRHLVRTTDHERWPQGLSLVDDKVFNAERLLGHQQITDVYLLGLAVQKGGRMVTLDQRVAVAAVHGAKPEHCLVI